jgi:hypothetical protein
MHNRPNAAELLLIARNELMSRILPALPEAMRPDVARVASAIAIAEREWSQAATAGAALPALLARALNPSGSGSHFAADAAAVDEAALLRLSMQIRAGEYNQQGPAQAALIAFMREYTRVRLAVTNPKILTQTETDPT